MSLLRLLSQLDETERAFDEFWVRHKTKLEQCLQLCHFEHNYREVSRRRSAAAQILRGLDSTCKRDPLSLCRLSAAGEDSAGSGV